MATRLLNAAKLTSKPTGKQRCDQTQKIIEHWNCFGNNPCYNPHAKDDGHPGPGGREVALVHAVAVAK